LIRLVKQDRKRSLRDLINEFSQSVPVPICKRSIPRRLSNYGFDKRIVGKTLTISLKIEKIMCDGAEIDYTGQYKNNGIKYYFLMKWGVTLGKIHVCMCGEKQKKGGTGNA
jgi:hypothetical protein